MIVTRFQEVVASKFWIFLVKEFLSFFVMKPAVFFCIIRRHSADMHERFFIEQTTKKIDAVIVILLSHFGTFVKHLIKAVSFLCFS